MTRVRGEGGAVLGSVARLAVVAAAAVTSLALATSMMAASVSGCNEAVCASIVSKCMLLQSCKCELQPDCTCCKVDRNNKCIELSIYYLLTSLAEMFRVSGLSLQRVLLLCGYVPKTQCHHT